MTGFSAEPAVVTAPDLNDPPPVPPVPPVLAGAVDQARAAVAEFAGAETVGDHLGVDYEDPAAATHRFVAHLAGYQGWQWAAVVAAYPGADHVTVSEVVLVPGPTALLAPEWVPWSSGSGPATWAPETCWRRPPMIRGWSRATPPVAMRRSMTSPARSAWAGAG